jgi:hypothetical protein
MTSSIRSKIIDLFTNVNTSILKSSGDDPIWIDRPGILLNPMRITEIFPMSGMSIIRKLNAIMRFVFIIVIIMLISSANGYLPAIVILIMSMVMTIYIYISTLDEPIITNPEETEGFQPDTILEDTGFETDDEQEEFATTPDTPADIPADIPTDIPTDTPSVVYTTLDPINVGGFFESGIIPHDETLYDKDLSDEFDIDDLGNKPTVPTGDAVKSELEKLIQDDVKGYSEQFSSSGSAGFKDQVDSLNSRLTQKERFEKPLLSQVQHAFLQENLEKTQTAYTPSGL